LAKEAIIVTENQQEASPMKKFFEEFKAFIAKGNVMDMAVAVVVGGAFSKIVNSLVNDVIMPLVSLAVGGLSVTDWKWVIKPEVLGADGAVVTAETALRYGTFLQNIIDFLIIAFCIFLVLKAVLKLKTKLEKPAEPEPEPVPEEPKETQEDILRDIRELLKK